MKAKDWFNLHAWAGLFVGVLLFVTCLSGTLATLSHEIEYLSSNKFRAINSESATDFSAIEKSLKSHYPGGQIINVLRHKQTYLSTEVSLRYNNEFLFVYVDGTTGELLGEGKWGRVSRFLRNWHMNLSLGWTGKLIVTSLSILLLILAVTSPIVYRQWWRYFFKKQATLKLANRSSWAGWHKLLGLWCYWFVVVMAATGIWYLVEHGLNTAKIKHYISPPQAVVELQPQKGQPLSLNIVAQQAKKAFPSLTIRSIRYPNSADKAIVVQGDNNDLLVRLRANKVYLNPVTGAVLGVQKAENLSALARIKDTADPLHFGNFAGLESKLIWGLFGFIMTFICGAGLYMNWLRIKRKKPSVLKWFGISGATMTILVITSVWITATTFSERSNIKAIFAPLL